MASITYRLGTTGTLVIAPEQPDGSKPDTAGMRAELRIPVAGQCLSLPAVDAPEGFEVDLAQLDLPAGIYPDAAIYFIVGAENFYAGALHLHIEGGC